MLVPSDAVHRIHAIGPLGHVLAGVIVTLLPLLVTLGWLVLRAPADTATSGCRPSGCSRRPQDCSLQQESGSDA